MFYQYITENNTLKIIMLVKPTYGRKVQKGLSAIRTKIVNIILPVNIINLNKTKQNTRQND